MKRIGLFLGSSSGGGELQYCLTFLEAVSSLHVARYYPVIVYSDPIWQKHIKDLSNLEVHWLQPSVSSKIVKKIWEMLGGSMAGWHRVNTFFEPVSKKLDELECDLFFSLLKKK